MSNQHKTPTRLQRILLKLAERHSPALTAWSRQQFTRDVDNWERELASRLASQNSLVVLIADEFEPSMLKDQKRHITDWVKSYQRFHRLLGQLLFPTTRRFHARYADDKMPPVVVITADPAPIATVFSGFVLPYLAIRQPEQNLASELELRGLMDMIIDHLQADDLPRAVIDEMRRSGVNLLVSMLQTRVRHLSLTDFNGQVLAQIQPSQSPPPPPRPETLPGESQHQPDVPPENTAYELPQIPDSSSESKLTATQDMFQQDIFLPGTRPLRRPTKRPPLPGFDDDEDN